jgi:hypothetical protein
MIPSPVLDWLLDPAEPSARYLTLRELLGQPEADPDVVAAREGIVHHPPARRILDAQYPAGYWGKPGRGYSPKYKATVWQLLFLADLGVPRTEAIARGCEHILSAALRRGQSLFSSHVHSTGIYPCLNGNLLRTFCHFGYGQDPRVAGVAGAIAQRVAELGWACPRSSTRVRDPSTWQPCIWGCVKVLRGLAAMPEEERGAAIQAAIAEGVQFLLRHDLTCDLRPALVDTPVHWLRFGFPLGEDSDLLEALLALCEAGALPLPPEAVRLLAQKQDAGGRWPLERALPNTWADFGAEGRPNKWVTLRAYRVLRDPFSATCGCLERMGPFTLPL